MSSNESALIPSQRMRVAFLLTFVGGFLDAYTYFERGGVFANAQTGNIVKLGIALANGTSEMYLFYLAPILAFAAGLVVSLAVEEILEYHKMRLVRRSVLAIEIAGLAVVGLIPLGEEWNKLANCIVSFTAAMQYETFTTFRGEAIVTTMSTGNLRKMIDSLFVGLKRRDLAKLKRAGLYFAIISTFTLGAFLGTRACDLLGRAAVIPVIFCLATAIGIITMLRGQNARERR